MRTLYCLAFVMAFLRMPLMRGTQRRTKKNTPRRSGKLCKAFEQATRKRFAKTWTANSRR